MLALAAAGQTAQISGNDEKKPAGQGSSAPSSPSGAPAAAKKEPWRPKNGPASAADASALKVDLAGLATEFKNNEPAASAKYRGKRVQIEGWAGTLEVTMVLFGRPPEFVVASVPIDDRTKFLEQPHIRCAAGDAAPWSVFNVRDRVVVTGTLVHEGVQRYHLADCTYSTTDGKPAPTIAVEQFAAECATDFKAVEKEYKGRWVNLTFTLKSDRQE
jgi:hypothetical protein